MALAFLISLVLARPAAPGAAGFGRGPFRLLGPGVPCSEATRSAGPGRGGATGWAPPADTTGFVLFGWVTPPDDSLNDARIAEMAALGFNLLLPTWLDEGCPGDNLARLDWAEAHGMRCLIWDSRLNGALQWLPTFEDTLDLVAAEYRDHPAFWGYYLGDEPPASIWPLLARLRASLRARDPAHPGWNTLRGLAAFPTRGDFQAQLRDYSGQFLPAVLSADEYDFRYGRDVGLFSDHLSALREVADERGIPFWNFIQLVPHGGFRPLQPGELRWQVSLSLAYGARGVGYFTYWTPDPDPAYDWQPAVIGNDGRRTGWYDFLFGFNPGVRAAGEVLARARWHRTTHAGSLPLGGVPFTPGTWIESVEGRAAIGEFSGEDGTRLVLAANADSLAARTVTLVARDAPGARLLASGSSPDALSVEPARAGSRLVLALAAGDFALLSLEPAVPRASLAAAPNPGRGAVRFDYAAPTADVRLVVTDLSGRQVWSSTRAASRGTVEWDGRRTDGRAARPGVYFARLAGAGGSTAAIRFVWLGGR